MFAQPESEINEVSVSIHKWAVDLNEKIIPDERLTRQTVLMVELMVTCLLKLCANDDMSTVC